MRNRRWIVLAILAAAVLVPGMAIASHQFEDVPNSNVFHNSIDWLADNAITLGCNPPTNDMFCPDRGVTRGEMATFLKRFHDRFIDSGGAPIGLGIGVRSINEAPDTGNGAVSGLSLTLTIPTSGIVVVTASADTENLTNPDAFYCGINTGGSPLLAQGDSWRVVDLRVNNWDTCAAQSAFSVTPGVIAARLVIAEALQSTGVYGGNITAILYPDSESFGLLSTADRQEGARALSDVPVDK